MLDGMLGANLVVFQKYSYSRHFASSCVRVCGYETVPGGVDVAGQVTGISHCAVGVDADRVGQDTYVHVNIHPRLTFDLLKSPTWHSAQTGDPSCTVRRQEDHRRPG